MGYEIEIIQINEYNRLTIDMYDREIFRCDIRNLMFNMIAEDDPVCQRAVKAVEEAKFRMYDESNVARHGSIERGKRELHSDSTNRTSIQENLPSNTSLIFEIPVPGHQVTSISKQKPVADPNNKSDEKIGGKVTIMEDKNTFLTEDTEQDNFMEQHSQIDKEGIPID